MKAATVMLLTLLAGCAINDTQCSMSCDECVNLEVFCAESSVGMEPAI